MFPHLTEVGFLRSNRGANEIQQDRERERERESNFC